jgi:hypothetical protein
LHYFSPFTALLLLVNGNFSEFYATAVEEQIDEKAGITDVEAHSLHFDLLCLIVPKSDKNQFLGVTHCCIFMLIPRLQLVQIYSFFLSFDFATHVFYRNVHLHNNLCL